MIESAMKGFQSKQLDQCSPSSCLLLSELLEQYLFTLHYHHMSAHKIAYIECCIGQDCYIGKLAIN